MRRENKDLAECIRLVVYMMRESKEMVARMGRENKETIEGIREVIRIWEEVALLNRKLDPPISEVLAVLKESSETDSVPEEFLESLTRVMRQMEAARKVTFREIRDARDAKINEMLRTVDRVSGR